MVSAEDLLLQEAKLSRSLKKTYERIKNTSQGNKNELFYANCILATYKYEQRPITDEFKKQMALKSGMTKAKLDKEFQKFEMKMVKSDKQIARDVGIKMKISFSIESKFIEFKMKYLNSLSATQKESTSAEPLAVITVYKEVSKNSKCSKQKYIKEFKKGTKLFNELCNKYDELMNFKEEPVEPKQLEKLDTTPIKRKSSATYKESKRAKKSFLVSFHEPLFFRCVPLNK
eukprot:NODE_922_length_3086_cov_0.393036.p2 type:complete len:230 gc:universal NODE_922_length_3086_cov_0.393036:791-102(-)